MTGMLNNTTVEIECPSCGRKIKESAGRLKNNHLLRCICGANLTLSTAHKGGIAQGMQTTTKAWRASKLHSRNSANSASSALASMRKKTVD